jgi:protease-4
MPDQLTIPYYEQWLGPWAMLPDAIQQTFGLFQKLDLHVHLQQQQVRQQAGKSTYQTAGKVAVIDIIGKLMKQEASMGGGTSTVLARRQIRAAVNDPDVSAIMLRIDSPGGTAAGTQDLAAEITAACKKKPVWAYVEDMAASAAYWAASQADRIIAGPTALVGSIGTYGVVQDLSGMAAMDGIKVHVIRAGQYKGAGTPGTEVNPEQLADMQRIVNGLNEHFLAGVANGRKMESDRVRELADGRAHLAAEAKRLDLIDEIGSFDEAVAKLQTQASKRSTSMQTNLAADAVDTALSLDVRAQDPQPEPQPVPEPPVPPPPSAKAATFAELKAGCPGADPAFLCQQMETGATLAAAQTSWMTEQNRRLEAAKQRPGVEPVGTKPTKTTGGQMINQADAVAAWNEAVAAKTAAGMTKAKAIRAVVMENPDLHTAYVEAANTAR